MTDKIINVAIIGAGEEAVPLIRTLTTLQNCKILGVADEKKDAPGLAVAGELGIKTYLDFRELLKQKELNLVIETSGSGSFASTLEKLVSPNVKIMDWASARLSLVLAEERERLLKIESSYKLTRRYSALLEEANTKLDGKLLELSLLNETSKSFSSAFDRRNVAGFIFSLLRKKIDFCVYALFLSEDQNYTLVLISNGSIPPELREEISLRMADRYAKYIKEPVDAKKVSIIEKIVQGPGKAEGLREPAIKNLCTAALAVLEKPLGMMGMVFCKEYNLTSDEERFFDILTGQVALFIENDRIKQAITHERNQLESILKSMFGALLVINEKRQLILINSVTEIFLGVKQGEILGRDLNEVILQDEIKELFHIIRAQRSEFFSKEIQLTNFQNGITRICKANLAKVHDHLGEVIGTVLILHDITKEKEVDRMKTEFISTTSHELRTPLASIKEAVSLIFDETAGEVNANQRKFLDIATRNINRLSELINSLLDLSKIESGKIELERSKVEINALVLEVVENFSRAAKEKKLALKISLAEGLPQVQADRSKINHVLTNLVSNAFKFVQAGTVTVSTGFYGADKNFIEVSVGDTGIGIEKKDFEKLFQKFQQLDSSLTRRASGTGLGLAISKQIVELHAGKIWAESEGLGKGSKFSFILPVIYEEAKMEKKNILVIDDEPDLCSTVKARLEANGFNVLTALSGQEGLDKVKEYKPDLIILDLMMPVMDGFEVCQRLKKDALTSAIPVVVLTALEQEEAAKKALSIGAEGYLVKPFEQESLLFTIREFLKRGD